MKGTETPPERVRRAVSRMPYAAGATVVSKSLDALTRMMTNIARILGASGLTVSEKTETLVNIWSVTNTGNTVHGSVEHLSWHCNVLVYVVYILPGDFEKNLLSYIGHNRF